MSRDEEDGPIERNGFAFAESKRGLPAIGAPWLRIWCLLAATLVVWAACATAVADIRLPTRPGCARRNLIIRRGKETSRELKGGIRSLCESLQDCAERTSTLSVAA